MNKPEPVGWVSNDYEYRWKNRLGVHFIRIEHPNVSGYIPLYTEDALAQARDEGYQEALMLLQRAEFFKVTREMALEEAAEVCEQHANDYEKYGIHDAELRATAFAIRLLKEKVND